MRPLGGAGWKGRRVVDDHGVGGEPRPQGRDRLVHRRVVEQHQVHPLRSRHRLGRAAGDARSLGREGLGLRARPVPDGQLRPAAGKQAVGEAAPEQPRSQQCDACHVGSSSFDSSLAAALRPEKAR
jgi:hypothetical protein